MSKNRVDILICEGCGKELQVPRGGPQRVGEFPLDIGWLTVSRTKGMEDTDDAASCKKYRGAPFVVRETLLFCSPGCLGGAAEWIPELGEDGKEKKA